VLVRAVRVPVRRSVGFSNVHGAASVSGSLTGPQQGPRMQYRHVPCPRRPPERVMSER
jgi:hypothetical protein